MNRTLQQQAYIQGSFDTTGVSECHMATQPVATHPRNSCMLRFRACSQSRSSYSRLCCALHACRPASRTGTSVSASGRRPPSAEVFIVYGHDAPVAIATDINVMELEEKDLHGHNGLVGRSGDLMGALSADIGDVGAEIGHIPRDLVMGAMSFQTMCSHWI